MLSLGLKIYAGILSCVYWLSSSPTTHHFRPSRPGQLSPSDKALLSLGFFFSLGYFSSSFSSESTKLGTNLKRRSSILINKITSIRQNFHLYRNKNGYFCYRQVIPRDVRHLFALSEFKRCLYTDNIYNAYLSSLLISNLIRIYINNIRYNEENTLNIL